MDRFNGGHRRLLACLSTSRMSRAERMRTPADEPSGGPLRRGTGHAVAGAETGTCLLTFSRTTGLGGHDGVPPVLAACRTQPALRCTQDGVGDGEGIRYAPDELPATGTETAGGMVMRAQAWAAACSATVPR